MDIASPTGYLIIMDPRFFQLANPVKMGRIDVLKTPKQAARILEEALFEEEAGTKIGLIPLSDGPGKYRFNEEGVSFWDVDNNRKSGRTIFGVELGSYIIFDIGHTSRLGSMYDDSELTKKGEKNYIESLNKKLSKDGNAMIWRQSMVGIGDGWHEVSWNAFVKVGEE
jgi:hypothetical protein